MNLGPTELIVILAIVLLILGSSKLPQLARSMGKASKEFEHGKREGARIPPAPAERDEHR